MGKVTDELNALITKRIQNNGIVIWYDPEKVYTEVVDHIDIPTCVVLHHQGSHLDLKYRLEPYLEFIGNDGQFKSGYDSTPRILVYVPLERSETQYALIEAEAAGVVMESGASPWQRNTRLKVLAERVFKRIAPDRAGAIAAEVEAGSRTLAELDWLADQTGEAPGRGLKTGLSGFGSKRWTSCSIKIFPSQSIPALTTNPATRSWYFRSIPLSTQ